MSGVCEIFYGLQNRSDFSQRRNRFWYFLIGAEGRTWTCVVGTIIDCLDSQVPSLDEYLYDVEYSEVSITWFQETQLRQKENYALIIGIFGVLREITNRWSQ